MNLPIFVSGLLIITTEVATTTTIIVIVSIGCVAGVAAGVVVAAGAGVAEVWETCATVLFVLLPSSSS